MAMSAVTRKDPLAPQLLQQETASSGPGKVLHSLTLGHAGSPRSELTPILIKHIN